MTFDIVLTHVTYVIYASTKVFSLGGMVEVKMTAFSKD